MLWKRSRNQSDSSAAESVAKPAKSKPAGERCVLPAQFLQKLIPVGQLSVKELTGLVITSTVHHPGEIIVHHGDSMHSLAYLVKGQCFLENPNGSGVMVEAKTFKACYPLCGENESPCTVIAKTDVTLIHFSKHLFQHSASVIVNPLLNAQDGSESLRQNPFFTEFCSYYRQGKLVLPGLPDVAIKLRMAMQKDIGVSEAVKIVSLDPVVSSRLIQIVNSPLYRTVNPISSCHDAIARLGLLATRNLVTSISLQNLFSSRNRSLSQRIHAVWKQSIQVSSISYTLAHLTGKVNPDEALLAGLVHNIGALPIILFADQGVAVPFEASDLDQTLDALVGPLGDAILESWGFPEQLKHVPGQADQWYYKSQNTLSLSDIVVLARFHSYIGTPLMHRLPLIHTLPAFEKLGDNTLSPDMSLQTLHDAKQQIVEAMRFFG